MSKDVKKVRDQQESMMLEIEDDLENIVYQSNMQLTLVKDLMDLAKLETLNFKFNEEYFDLPELIKQAFKTIKREATKKGIILIQDYQSEIFDSENQINDPSLSQNQIKMILKHVYGDKCRYMQILLNFLSNAVKFTNQGHSIKVRVKLLDIQLIEKNID